MKRPTRLLLSYLQTVLSPQSQHRSARRRRSCAPARSVEVCEARTLLAADFSFQFQSAFAGQADNQVNITLSNPPVSGGTLNAWIDFDDDGEFSGAREKIFSNQALTQGANSLQFEIPFSVMAGNHNARLTVSTSDPDTHTENTSLSTLAWQSAPVVGTSRDLSSTFFGPTDIVSADFDNDGDIDVFTSNINGSETRYYENNGVGTFTEHTPNLGLDGILHTLEAADMNDDGLLDIIAGNTSNGLISIYFQQSPGIFSETQVPTPASSQFTGIADFNGDGRLDMLTSGQDVTLLMNNGNETFSASTVEAATNIGALAVGDIDGDGDIDAVLESSFEIRLYRNNGAGTFAIVNDFITSTEITDLLRMYDVNRDGRMDVVGTRFVLGNTFWFENTGSGFTERTTTIPGGLDDIKLGDINGDGFVDVLGAAVLPGADIFINSGDNLTFTPLNLHDELSESIEAVDIDGDGDLDFVTEESNTVLWYENLAGAPLASNLVLNLPATVAEDAGTITGTVQRPPGVSNSVALTVSLQSSNPAAVAVPSSVTIAAGSGSATFDLTVTDDLVTNGNQIATISASAAGASPGSAVLSIIDNEAAGIILASSGSDTSVSEDGTTDSFTVALTAPPLSDVTVILSSGDTSQLTLDFTSVTFTPTTWNQPQSVTVSAVSDTILDGDRAVAITAQVDAATSADAYDSVPIQQLAVSVIDDEVAELIVDTTSGNVSEGGAAFTALLSLSAEPLGDVTVQATAADTTEVTAAPASFLFSPANWNIPQQVTITGVDDVIVDGTTSVQVTLSVDADNSVDAFDSAAPVSINVDNADNDTPGFALSETQLAVSENGTEATFDVVLTAAPLTNVVLNVASSDATASTAVPTSLTFTAANWNVPQVVTVSGTNDDVADGDQMSQITVTVDAEFSDDAFGTVAGSAVNVATSDDDVVGFSISQTALTLPEADADGADVDIQLTSEPASAVVINLTLSDPSEAMASATTLTFTPQNWQTPQTVNVAAINDAHVDGDQQGSLTVQVDADASDGAFADVFDRSVALTTTDDDVAGVAISSLSAEIVEGGASVDVAITLTAAPLTTTVVNIASLRPEEVSTDVATLTFDADNWDTAQLVTISAIDDERLDGTTVSAVTVSIDATMADAAFAGLSEQTISVSVTDNDTAGIIVSKETASVSEDGTFDFFDVSLNVEPTTAVVVQVNRRESGEVLESPNRLIFTAATWNISQRVMLRGVDDAIIDGDQTTLVDISVDAAESDDAFDSLTAQTVSVVTTDNDTENLRPGIIGPNGRIDDATPTISWASVTGASSYELWLEDLNGDENPVLNPTVSDTSYNITTPLPISRYRAWVRANFGDGSKSTWAAERFTVAVAPEISPIEFRLTDLTPTIEWTSPAGASETQVFIRNVTANNSTIFDGVVTGNQLTVAQDLGFGLYQVWVRSIATGGLRAAWSQAESFYVGPDVIGPTANSFNSQPTLTWTTMQDIASFRLQVRRLGDTDFVIDEGNLEDANNPRLTGTTFTPSTPLPDGDYHWWILPFTASGGRGVWSAAGQFRIGGQTELVSAASSLTGDTTTLTWNPVEGATEYEVFVRNQFGIVERATGVQGPEFTVPFPLSDGNHTAWVRSSGAGGRISAWSRAFDFNVSVATEVAVATPSGAVTPTFERPAQLRWTATENAASFDLIYEVDGQYVHQAAVTGNSFALPNSISTGRVRWWVKANTAEGNGAWSRPSVLEFDTRPITDFTAAVVDSPAVIWTPVTGAVRYLLQINQADPDALAIREDDVQGTRWDVSTLPTGQYRAWVLAVSASGERSLWSTPVSFTID